jgi:hypothetical protein
MTATTSRTQIKFPSVYPLTIPSSQRMIRMIAIVSSMQFVSSARPARLRLITMGCNLGTAKLARTVVLVVVLAWSAATSAAAQSVSDVAAFIGGGAIGLAAHETGHILFDVALGVPPGLKKVTFGPVPFFAITHDPVTPAREFAISSAGFWMQHLSSELILISRPRLRHEHAPFLKGILAFNVLASTVYATAAVARVGPDERDTRGMALGAGTNEPVIGALVLTPALLDAARYWRPENVWLKWSSRAAKIAGVVFIVRAVE